MAQLGLLAAGAAHAAGLLFGQQVALSVVGVVVSGVCAVLAGQAQKSKADNLLLAVVLVSLLVLRSYAPVALILGQYIIVIVLWTHLVARPSSAAVVIGVATVPLVGAAYASFNSSTINSFAERSANVQQYLAFGLIVVAASSLARRTVTKSREIQGLSPPPISLLVAAISAPQGLAALNISLGFFTSLVDYTAAAVLLWRLTSNRNKGANDVDGWVLVCVAASVLVGLGTGQLGQAVLLPGTLIVFWATRSTRHLRLTLLTLAAVTPILVIVNSGKAVLRDQSFSSGDRANGGAADGVELLFAAFDAVGDEDVFRNSAERLAYSADVLGVAVRAGDQERMRWQGSRLIRQAAWAAVPRVLVPSKPRLNSSNEFGREFAVINSTDYRTAVNMPVHLEGYLIGGWVSYVSIALGAGIFMAMLDSASSVRGYAGQLAAQVTSVHLILSINSGLVGLVAAPIVFYWVLLFISFFQETSRPSNPSREPKENEAEVSLR